MRLDRIPTTTMVMRVQPVQVWPALCDKSLDGASSKTKRGLSSSRLEVPTFTRQSSSSRLFTGHSRKLICPTFYNQFGQTLLLQVRTGASISDVSSCQKAVKVRWASFGYHRIINAVRSTEPLCIVSSKVPKALAPVGTHCGKRCHCIKHRFTPTRMYKKATSKNFCNISTVVSNTYLI